MEPQRHETKVNELTEEPGIDRERFPVSKGRPRNRIPLRLYEIK